MAVTIPPLPATNAQALSPAGNVFDPVWLVFFANLRRAIVDRTTILVKDSAPSVDDVPQGEFRIIKNTSGPTIELVANDGGVLVSVALT